MTNQAQQLETQQAIVDRMDARLLARTQDLELAEYDLSLVKKFSPKLSKFLTLVGYPTKSKGAFIKKANKAADTLLDKVDLAKFMVQAATKHRAEEQQVLDNIED